MKRIISALIISLLVFLNTANLVLAQEAGTLLPEKSADIQITGCSPNDTNCHDCDWILNNLEKSKDPVKTYKEKMSNKERNDVLACGIITGNMSFWMIPYYIVYFIEFAIGISGLVAILFLVIAGFQYIASGADESQDKAKGTIMHALIGIVIVLVAWVVVNLIQFALTI